MAHSNTISTSEISPIIKFPQASMHWGACRQIRCFYSTNPSKGALLEILKTFKAPVSYCFGYGSGVFSQGVNQRKRNTQVDLILGVENSKKWHEINIEQNHDHYSALRFLGPSVIEKVQRNLGAGIYFNPFCTINGIQVKYGVVELQDLQKDLENWDTLYLAGRLHKPVQILQDNPKVQSSQRENLLAAAAIALLMLPPQFSERELYMKIAGISYMGDVRMAFAENPNKVRNIVDNQFALFRQLYSPIFDSFPLEYSPLRDEHVGPDAKGTVFTQSVDVTAREKLLDFLPQKFRKRLERTPGTVTDGKIRAQVSAAVLSTIKKPSFTQSLKGLLTAGPARSAAYSYEKLKKRWKS